MTRMEKYRHIHLEVLYENMKAYRDFDTWWYFFTCQKEIKAMIGARH